MTEEQARVRALQIACRGKFLSTTEIIERAERYARFIMTGKKKED